ncbi:MAG TPA: YaaL family protein [Candidatus Lachnoclostridium stercoravium]|uniref:YaaL family protein n=1 Tax=Candidatus Lachnoclostridium stercoravium TaxID=2838633 RepID=A0A9D2KNC8_9FIRM|nr:YaaL family protein [Candidatus Lachnoclostridium stercoravium]
MKIKTGPAQDWLDEQLALREEIKKTENEMDVIRNHFEQVVDPTLIDCYIYQLNAVQLRYQFLLRRFKRQEAVQSLPL